MNHAYRLVCNAQGRPCVPAPESARGRGKAGGRSLKPLAVVLAAGFVASGAWAAPAADALPTGGQVVAGQAGISQSGNTLTVSQGSDKAIIDWQRFDIGSSAAVQFLQPSSSSVALNRVLSGDASQIYGSLTANGQVYLINPAGVVFGSGSKVDVGALVASTLDITNEDFLAGRLVFSRDGATGSVLNQGEITAAEGGLVALLAPTVKNEGIVSARLGNVVFAAGDKVTLAAGADGLLQVALEPATVQTLIENKQLIVADGGQVLMTSKAADALSAGIVANSGTIQARTLQEQEGRILLLADMSHGEVRHSGLLDASAPDSGDGGFIETSAATVTLEAGRKVTTLAANGQTGTWLIDPNDYTIAASGGNITGAQLSADLALTSVSISTATQGTAGGNGDIFVNDTVSWNAATTLTLNAERNIEINAPITVAHAGGGLALNYGGSDYSLGAPVSFTAGSGGSFSVNGQAYTLIHSMAGLTAINSMDLSGRYALAINLDASGTTYGQALIGHMDTFFNGTFTGLGHTISNLTVDGGTSSAGGSSSHYVGLFGYTLRNSLIRDLGLVDVSIHGYQAVGGLVGVNYGTLKGVFVTGEVWAEDGGVGGLVGWNVGRIENAYAGTEVAGDYDVGGLVGWNSNDPYSGQQGYILNAYSVSTARDSSGSFGGLVGTNWLNAASSVVNSYYYGSAGSYGGTGGSAVNADQLKNLSTFSGWDIDNAGGTGSTWRIYEGYSMPLLRAFLTPVTVSVSLMGDKTYDGYYASGSSGVYLPPDDVTLLIGSGAFYYATTGANAGAYSTAAGNLRITSNALYSDQTGYDIVYEGALTISKATLTVTANNAAKTYDGQAWSGGNGVSYSGFAGSEDAAVLGGALSYGGSSQGAVDAGSYAISASGLSSNNYSFDYVSGTLTVDKAALTVRSYGDSKTYDGLAYAGSGIVSYSGFVNDEDASVLSGSLAYGGDAQGAVNAGSYTISLSGLSANNYAISYVDGGLTVNKAALTVTANDAAKTYDGLAWSGGNGASYSGLVNGETAAVLGGSLIYGGDAQGAVNAGDYSITASGLNSDNYVISYQSGALAVDKAALTVRSYGDSKTYDGLAYAGGGIVSYSGFVNGENASVLSGSLAYGGDAQGAVNAGDYTISLSGLSAGNYAISYADGTLTVGKAALTVTASDAAKTYDGLAWSGGNGANYSGLVNGETAAVLGGALSYGGDAQGAVNAGSYGISVSGLSSDNYVISYADGTLTVGKAALTVTASDAAKTYDGLAWSGGNGASYSGLVNGETAAVLGGALSYGGDAQGAVNAGSYGISVSGLSSDNYVISYVDGALTVGKATLTVTASDAAKTYDGLAWSGGNGASYSGFVNGEDASVLSGALAYGGGSQGAVATGRYVITPGGLGSGNYAIQFIDGTLTIGRPISAVDGGRLGERARASDQALGPVFRSAAVGAGLVEPPPLSLAQGFIALPAVAE